MEYLSPMARDTRSESHDRHIRTNTGPPLTRGGSGINDNNTSGNQICYMVHGNCVSNETAQESNVCGYYSDPFNPNGSDKDLIFFE